MLAEKEYLKKVLKEAGIKSEIHFSMKALKRCNEVHVGAILTEKESFTRESSKKQYEDQSGAFMRRRNLFRRESLFTIVIGESSEEKCEKILTEFLKRIGTGFEDMGNWVEIEIGEADWVPEEDSILKSKMACQLAVTCHNWIHTDGRMMRAEPGSIVVE